MKLIDFRSFDWDDTELRRAYDRVLEARKANKKGSQKKEIKWRKWKVGDYCRAIYPADKSYYEAKVISLNGDFCTVEFLGFGDTEDIDLLELQESEGKEAQKKQIKAFMADSSDHNSSIDWKVGDYCRAIYSADKSYYEAKVISLDGDFCTVEFLGYGDTEDVDVLELKESEGKKAQQKQIKASMEDSSDHNSSIDWKVGDYCRAIYSADKLYYEAKIISLDGDFCTVKFLGFGDTEDIDLLELQESEGKEAQQKQIKASMADSSDHNSSIDWKVGDYCRAIYSADKLYYEAKIISLDGDFCTVKFLGYGNTEDIDLLELKESEGKKAQKKQIKASMADSFFHNSSINTNMPFIAPPVTMPQHPVPPAPPMPQYTVPLAKPVPPAPPMPQCPRLANNPSFSSMLTAWYTAGYYTGINPANMPFITPPVTMPQHPVPPAPPVPQYTVHPAPPMPHAKPMPLFPVPPAPPMPLCRSPANNPSFSSMLSSWYMAGYNTGINFVQKKNHGCRRCCSHSNQCCRN